ncbi:hypothetical protein [Winogradskyella schleiferi]|uniref:hypothetical protein n=1 Tax=Winogradskyella schleiferi TaxID=2686078 RepID=UPI0015BCAEA3|nr:hypothetical protein [Winogradskyella schleiferi]
MKFIMELMETAWKIFGKEFPRLFHCEFVVLTGKKIHDMQEKLLLEAFEKARKEVNSDKVFTRARHLSEQIYEINQFTFGERSLTEKFKTIKSNHEGEINLRKEVLEALSKYLSYDSFFNFSKVHKIETQSNKIKLVVFIKKYSAVLIVSILLISSILIYKYTTRQRWMVWQNDQYIEVDFDVKKYDINQLKIYKEERIKYFKKVFPSCEHIFFEKDGSIRIWYGKNKEKELEYFTALGLHPETGKTLKPITEYMINKHICK